MSKFLIAEDAGVKLYQVMSGAQVHYRLTTMRPNQPRVLADREEAVEAFSREVEASKADPVVRRLLQMD